MRSALARHPPAARHLSVVRPLAPPGAKPATAAARRALQVGGATIAFLLAYTLLTILHAVGREPAVIGALSPVPLFARIAACSLAALPIGVLARGPTRMLRAMPAALALATGLAVLAILVFA